MEHPGEAFLASMEEDLMKLIIKQGQTVSLLLHAFYANKSSRFIW